MDKRQQRISLPSALQAGLAFGVLMGLLWGWLYGWRFGGIGGITGGLLFGTAIGLFGRSKTVGNQMELDLDADEQLVHVGAANHFKGAEAVGGRLYLTSHRLVFKSHKYNLQPHEIAIPVQAIEGVNAARTLGIVPNGLIVRRKNGSSHRFVVGNRKRWMAALRTPPG